MDSLAHNLEDMNPYFEQKGITLYQADCLEAMRLIPDASIDACITDPPYGTTACSWDSVIPFAPMWVELKRIVKKNGAIVLFGSQPFTSALVMSNPQMFRYQWYWKKERGTGFVMAAFRPLNIVEDVTVFYREQCVYNAQKTLLARPYIRTMTNTPSASGNARGLSARPEHGVVKEYTHRTPTAMLEFSRENGAGNDHPTQKPVDLLRYLVRTYTNEGDSVLDFTCGSGTTGVACVIEKRGCVLIEQDPHYCEVSAARIKRAQGVACDIPKRVKQYAPAPLFDEVLNFEAVA